MARVEAITNEGLFVQTLQGPRLVEVEEDTEIQGRRGEELALTDLGRGMQVAIFEDFSEDGRRLVADTIIVVPTPRQ